MQLSAVLLWLLSLLTVVIFPTWGVRVFLYVKRADIPLWPRSKQVKGPWVKCKCALLICKAPIALITRQGP